MKNIYIFQKNIKRMTLEAEFEKQVGKKKSDSQVVALVRNYHKRIEESDFAQNTRFTKMSRINMVVKRIYPHLYEQVRKFNVPNRQEKKSAIKERNEFNMNRLENRQEFSYSEIINDIKTLKNSEDYYKLVVCVLLATGRRSAEVIARGEFEPLRLSHHVLFSGQLKAGDEKRDAYEIPVVGLTPKNLIQLVEKIRTMKDYSNETNMFIASRTNAYVNRAIANVLGQSDRHVTSETCRCIYAYIAYRLYGNQRISEAVYCSKILGHKGSPNVFVNNYNRIFVKDI
jgi:Telomere resolvase